MIDYSNSFQLMKDIFPKEFVSSLEEKVPLVFERKRWGDMPDWLNVVDQLPMLNPAQIDLNAGAITVGSSQDCDDRTRQGIQDLLMKLHPWRKGPFDLFGVRVDTEWRSDLKWDRLEGKISSLENNTVLDIGCASGYHCLRAMGQKAKFVLGVDPVMLYVIQFYVFQKYIRNPSVCVLPLGIDELPDHLQCFDTVFSMGLLYHRRSPLDHLLSLKSFLKKGGQLVLETLVIDGDLGQVLNPKERYAKMPNVWFIPSVPTLESWLVKTGFSDIDLIDISVTTSSEQRVTEWMGFESLADFLDPDDPQKTIEGYPAPKRAMVLARNS